MDDKKKMIHLMGIGGAGMSALAKLLLEAGYAVSGCDRLLSPLTEELQARGVRIISGHAPSHLEGAETVVYSSAIPEENPELAAAREALAVLPRAEMLARVVQDREVIAVSGTHGKTTTASLIATVLEESGMAPGFALGSFCFNLGENARRGQGRHFVLEADESDGSLLHLSPQYAVLTNLEREHLDYYGNLENMRKVFADFLRRMAPEGICFYSEDDPELVTLCEGLSTETRSFGLLQGEVCIQGSELTGETASATVLRQGAPLGKIRLRVPGRHNLANAIAATAVSLRLGIDFERISRALENFSGCRRRFELKGRKRQIEIIEDYAHHPTEIRATIRTARLRGKGRIVTIFQPHRYSRTQLLVEEFATAFAGSDLLILTDVYAADEEPIPGVTGETLVEAVRPQASFPLIYIPDRKKIAEKVFSLLQKGDRVLILGAGNIDEAGEELLTLMKEAP